MAESLLLSWRKYSALWCVGLSVTA